MDDRGIRHWRSRVAGLAGIGSVALALLACYGTLTVLALLSMLGIALAVDDAVVGGVVSSLAVLAAIAIGAGARRHGSLWPAALAVAGASLVAFALLVVRDWRVELAGFALLVAAAVVDARRRRTRIDEASRVARGPVDERTGGAQRRRC